MFILNIVVFFGLLYAGLILLISYLSWRTLPLNSFSSKFKKDLRSNIKLFFASMAITIIAFVVALVVGS